MFSFGNINWNFLLDNLEDGRCILCVGPDIFTEPGSPRFEQRLAEFLRNHADELRITVYENGWFHYRKGTNKSTVRKKLNEFFEASSNPYAVRILEDLSHLPFEVVISFSPDYLVKKSFSKIRPKTQFRSFLRDKPCEFVIAPTVDSPLIFNMLGELSQGDTLVLTYQDTFNYLESFFTGKRLPDQLEERMKEAEHFLFLGMPFDRWYTHLFMSIINSYVDQRKDKDESVHRLAANPFLSTYDINLSSEQYALTFIQEDIGAFAKELRQKCSEKNLLVQGMRMPSNEFEVWRDGIHSGDTESVKTILDAMLETCQRDYPRKKNEASLLKNRYHSFLTELAKGGFETHKAQRSAESQIISSILHLISELESEIKG